MSEYRRPPDRPTPESEHSQPARDERPRPRHDWPRRFRQMGNAALSRLLDRPRPGQPLDSPAREPMERSFGADFGAVRLHQDPAAREAADALDATAFTQGDDIYLGSAAPAPESPAGRGLLAHELAHVAQQRQAGTKEDGVSQPGDHFEQAAEQAAAQAKAGAPAKPLTGGAPPAVQRQFRRQPQSTPRKTIPRSEAQRVLQSYLERYLAAQGRSTLKVTEVQPALLRLFINDAGGRISLELWMNGNIKLYTAAGLAAKVAGWLPPQVDEARLTHLQSAPAPTTAGSGPSVLEQAAQAVELPAPGEPERPGQPSASAAAQQQAEQQAQVMRRHAGAEEPTELGPVNVDILRAGRAFGQLRQQPAPPQPHAPTAAVSQAIEGAVARIKPDALIPARVRGTPLAASLDDAQTVARELGRRLDEAHGKKWIEVEVRLSAAYRQVAGAWDELLPATRRIIDLIRDALPHKAANVVQVKVYFGRRLPRLFKVRPE